MRGSRSLFHAFLVGLFVAMQAGGVLAEIPVPDPAVVDPVSVNEEDQATVDTALETAEVPTVPVDTAVEPVGQIEEMVTTVEETAVAIVDTVETVVGEIQQTVETVEQTAAPVEETIATTVATEETGNPVEGAQVVGAVATQGSNGESEASVAPAEQTASEAADPVTAATQIADPVDSVEVLGGVLQDSVTTVEETVVLAGPIDAVEVLGGVLQDSVTTVEETVVLAGPIDAVEVLGGVLQDSVTTVEETVAGQDIVAAVSSLEGELQNTVDTVEATAQQMVDSVGVLQQQIEEAAGSLEQTAEQTAQRVEALEALGVEIHETKATIEATAQEIVEVLEVFESKIEKTVTTLQATTEAAVDAVGAAASDNKETVDSVEQTAQQVVDVVEVLQAQTEKAITTVDEIAHIVELIEVLEAQIQKPEMPAVESTQRLVGAVEGLDTEIGNSLGLIQETVPHVVVAIEGLVGKLEHSIQLADVGSVNDGSVVTPEETGGEPAGPVDALEVLGNAAVTLQRRDALGESVIGGKIASAGDSAGSLDSAMSKDGSVASTTNSSLSIGTTDVAGGRSLLRGAVSPAGRKGSNLGGARFLLNWTAILGASQPSLAILVDAMNDADQDGIFSDSEIAAAPGADVNVKALITNIGAVNFEIATLTHSYGGSGGALRDSVCSELVGLILDPGETLACTFPLADYSPPAGQSLVNTVMAAGFEVGKGARRGASDSDSSTVQTIVANDEVLAAALKRNLAFTGTDAARLVALGLLLLVVGVGFLSLARLRTRRPLPPLPSDSPIDVLGWWAAGPSRSGSMWKVGRN